MADAVEESPEAGERPDATPPPAEGRDRGKTVHGEAANAGHRVLAPDDAEVEAYLETALNAPAPDRTPDDGLPPAEALEPDRVIVLDFGSQFAQLIARRVRELNVYSELLPHDTPWAEIERRRPKAIILSGSPNSVYDADAPKPDSAIWNAHIPVLGICYGAQLMAHELGGDVAATGRREYGPATVTITAGDGLFEGLDRDQPVWMSHGDSITRLPEGFRTTAQTDSSPLASFVDPSRGLYAIQFHPEVVHTPHGRDVLRNFVIGIAGARPTWTAANFVEATVAGIRARVDAHAKATGSDGWVICALSGGVDSAVAAALVHRAVGDRLTCIYVDHGLMRKKESELLRVTFEANLGMRLIMVDARERFLRRLAGVVDPEEKRRIIGDEFIRVFEEEATKLGRIDFLTQGTLYPDVIEIGDARRRRRPRRSRPTTTWADCRPTCASSSSSRCATCSRTRSGRSAWSLACPTRWSSASRSRVRGWRSGSSARSPRSAWTRSATPTGSSSTRSRPPASTAASGSPSRSSPRSARSASWATDGHTRTSSRSVPSRRRMG